MQTELKLGACGFPPMSARNCSQELFPLAPGRFYRDINGKLVFIDDRLGSKYKTVITGKDENAPALSGISVGSVMSVGCIQYIWKKVPKYELTVRLERPVVEGSVIAVNDANEYLDFLVTDGAEVRLSANPDGCYVGFRPWLTMVVLDFSLETDEWGICSKWKLVMEEV